MYVRTCVLEEKSNKRPDMGFLKRRKKKKRGCEYGKMRDGEMGVCHGGNLDVCVVGRDGFDGMPPSLFYVKM